MIKIISRPDDAYDFCQKYAPDCTASAGTITGDFSISGSMEFNKTKLATYYGEKERGGTIRGDSFQIEGKRN